MAPGGAGVVHAKRQCEDATAPEMADEAAEAGEGQMMRILLCEETPAVGQD